MHEYFQTLALLKACHLGTMGTRNIHIRAKKTIPHIWSKQHLEDSNTKIAMTPMQKTQYKRVTQTKLYI